MVQKHTDAQTPRIDQKPFHIQYSIKQEARKIQEELIHKGITYKRNSSIKDLR